MKMLAGPLGIWSKLKDPKKNLDRVFNGKNSKRHLKVCTVYWALLWVNDHQVGSRTAAARAPLISEANANRPV